MEERDRESIHLLSPILTPSEDESEDMVDGTHMKLQRDTPSDGHSIVDNASVMSDNDESTGSRKRWLMLLIFSINTMMNALLFISLSPINHVVSKYYGIEPYVLEWFPNSYFLVYTFMAIPGAFCMEYFGLRPILLTISGLQSLASCLRLVGAKQDGFVFVVIGQVFAAFSYCGVLQIPARLSAVWFPKHERTLATSIGASMNILGVALAFVLSTQIVPETDDLVSLNVSLRNLYIIQMVLCVVGLLFAVTLFEEQPKRPSKAQEYAVESDAVSFMTSLKNLALNIDFHLLAQGYAIYFGLFNFFAIILNDVIRSRFPYGYTREIGWIGFSFILVSIPSSAIYGMLLDKFRHFRLAAVFLNFSAFKLMLTFMLVLSYTKSFSTIFSICTFYGTVAIPYYAIGLEQAAVMTHPVPEGISSAVMLALGNLYGFVFVVTLGIGIDNGYIETVGYVMVGLYAISTFLVAFAKVEVEKK